MTKIDFKNHFRFTDRSDVNCRVFMAGIVLANNTGQSWDAAFVEHNDHLVKLTIDITENGTSLPNYPRTIRASGKQKVLLQLVPKNSSNRPDSHRHRGHVSVDETFVEHLGDFSSEELYNGPVRVKRPDTKNVVRFRVNNGRAFTGRIADGNNGVPDIYRFRQRRNVPRILGHWIGIENACRLNSYIRLTVDASMEFEHQITGGQIISVYMHNVCAQTTCESTNDFPLYYGDDGIIDMPQIDLDLIAETKKRSAKAEKGILNYRVACNLMIASSISGGVRLFDL